MRKRSVVHATHAVLSGGRTAGEKRRARSASTRFREKARASIVEVSEDIIDVIRGRWSPAELENKIKATARWDGEETRIRIPQDPGQAGKFQAAYLAGQLRGYSVSSEREEGNKERRADPFAAQCEHRFVKLVAGDWHQAFVDELCAFPNGAHDDQVDVASAAFRALLRRVTWHAA